jgi:hypothetical protein
VVYRKAAAPITGQAADHLYGGNPVGMGRRSLFARCCAHFNQAVQSTGSLDIDGTPLVDPNQASQLNCRSSGAKTDREPDTNHREVHALGVFAQPFRDFVHSLCAEALLKQFLLLREILESTALVFQ